MRALNKMTDRVLDKLLGKTTAAAACYEQIRECNNAPCGNGGLRRCCRSCTLTGVNCQNKSCGAYSCGLCSLP
ncbi:hypothetical protein AB0I28_13185 [Phytomonospora sp. NPDC050363]|uniref:hypothetical protein n=1 Tax=Phytomonospora sp. NPDC050363 TaxID=3155642 RepID=UPI0034067493